MLPDAFSASPAKTIVRHSSMQVNLSAEDVFRRIRIAEAGQAVVDICLVGEAGTGDALGLEFVDRKGVVYVLLQRKKTDARNALDFEYRLYEWVKCSILNLSRR